MFYISTYMYEDIHTYKYLICIHQIYIYIYISILCDYVYICKLWIVISLPLICIIIINILIIDTVKSIIVLSL
jgi:hypothetical protein